MVNLEPMTQSAYDQFLSTQIKSYAQAKVEAGNWQAEHAQEKAKAEFNQLLPDDLETANMHLFSVKDQDTSVGHLWINEQNRDGKKVIWIYDIVIYEDHRRQGYGHQTLQALTDFVRDNLDTNRIELHVFGNNEAAINLYKQFGFDVTNIIMGFDVE